VERFVWYWRGQSFAAGLAWFARWIFLAGQEEAEDGAVEVGAVAGADADAALVAFDDSG
jgi:hypothetical protein